MKKINTNFTWGVAASSFQIEGAWDADGKGENIWDRFSHKKGNVKNNDNGDVACDHYNKYPEDIALIKNLGVDSYRLSISWSRLFPDGIGQKNQAGFDFYNRVFDELLENKIIPLVTLYHWDLPQALQDKGGWENRDIVDWFSEYADAFSRAFEGKIKNYCVINEPSVTSYLGHYLGVFAPGIKSRDALYASTHHQNLVNGVVTKILRQNVKDSFVGSSYTCFPVYAHDSKNPLDVHAAKIIKNTWVDNYLDPLFLGHYPKETIEYIEKYIKGNDLAVIKCNSDYIGINHYSPNFAKHDDTNDIKASLTSAPEGRKNDLGWLISPEDFKITLSEVAQKYNNPLVYITENGMCELSQVNDSGIVDDVRRINYLDDYISAMFAAQKEGCNIGGYYQWSLLDNFEWAEGYDARFGIVYVDFKTQKRTPKNSYHWFKKRIIKHKEDVE